MTLPGKDSNSNESERRHLFRVEKKDLNEKDGERLFYLHSWQKENEELLRDLRCEGENFLGDLRCEGENFLGDLRCEGENFNLRNEENFISEDAKAFLNELQRQTAEVSEWSGTDGDAVNYLIEQNLEQSVENHNKLISSSEEEVIVTNNDVDDSSPEEEVIVTNNDVDDSEKTFKVEEIEEIINKKEAEGKCKYLLGFLLGIVLVFFLFRYKKK